MADMLSQDEIDALLGGNGSGGATEESPMDLSMDSPMESMEMELLTPEEKDAVGEIGNISMGTSATTLFMLLNQKVNITTPRVTETTLKRLAEDIKIPCVVVIIRYVVGIKGINLLILKEDDVKIITDLMMGGDGTNKPPELTDMHLSAINEAMNQMIGSASTSLSGMLGRKIDITPPEVVYSEVEKLDIESLGIDTNERLAMVSFKMTVGDLIDSEIMQIMTVEVAREMIDGITAEVASNIVVEDTPPPAVPPEPIRAAQETLATPPPQPQPSAVMADMGIPPQPQGGGGYYQEPPRTTVSHQPVNAMPFQFDSFETGMGGIQYGTEIDLIRDVPLEITVELGRTKRKISDILDLGVGSVIELDKLVGESLDILANGKKIAMGEVVVVDENYGIRLAEIVSTTKK